MGNGPEIRRGQLIAPFGVGAMVDFPDETLMSAGLDFWPSEISDANFKASILDSTKIVDARLQQQLSAILKRPINYFLLPTEGSDRSGFSGGSQNPEKQDMPFVRFPTWCFCPRCKIMEKIGLEQNLLPKCTSKKRVSEGNAKTCGDLPQKFRPTLKPIRFLMACENGHIDDFPWYNWLHKGEDCSGNTNATGSGNLFLKSTSQPGLAGIVVHCINCSKQRSMVGAFKKDVLKDYVPYSVCTGRKPWLGSQSENDCNCNAMPQTIQRGASNTYFSNTMSSILIPPYSKTILTMLENNNKWDEIKDIFDEELTIIDDEYSLSESGEKQLKKKANRWGINYKTLYETSIIKFGDLDNLTLTKETNEEFRFKEFNAFIGQRPEPEDRRDFDIEETPIENYQDWFQIYFKRIVCVPQLRETRALTGFSRLKPGIIGEEQVNLSNNTKDWLPATEVRGEGIFLEFRAEELKKWEKSRTKFGIAKKKNQKIMDAINSGSPNFSRRDSADEIFLLVHSFAHALIRQLAFECGYDSGALNERIFVSTKDETLMAGLLVYTANGDAEGSLGGLVAQGQPKFIEKIVKSAIENAEYCSNDPICMETQEQGHQGLNAAACHSCLLLPETCCEHNNLLLDRSTLVGDGLNLNGFFKL
ncbi:DUF1998 domain-containing protein [Amylibacter sp.]|nr:DUF1998 domain-containing protein [Amylibacter sp.]MDC0121656.1 DUF1998 domain-containing protein [Amylibacter sp.]